MVLSDHQSLQGLWRVVSYVARGRPVGTGTTHYQFDGSRVKEIDPSRVEGGDWATFRLDPNVRPKRFTMTSERIGKGGKPFRRVDRWLYELQEDTLRLCWPNVFGDYPDVLSEQIHGVVTLVRDHGPPPKTKQPSGKKAVEDWLLGRVSWNDDFDWWEAHVNLTPGVTVDVHIELGDVRDDATAIAAGRDFVRWLRQHEQEARLFAAAKLLDLYNDNWNESQPISIKTFAARMTLEGVGIHPGGRADLCYDDGDLFAGHWIIVWVGKDREFQGTEMAG